MTMYETSKVLQAFSKAIYAKVRFLRTRIGRTQPQCTRILESISDDIRKCTNFVKPEVSVAADKEARRQGVALNEMTWHDQRSFDPGRKRFHLEHVVPVSAVRNACLEALSAAAVLEVLTSQLRVAWILKEEDAELTRLGFKRRRPHPDAAYRQAAIRMKSPGR